MVGKTLGHYEILEPLGKGGMGEVYLAEDTRLDRKVALKILPPELAVDSERLLRFEREAKTVAALDHPNIVTVYSIETATPETTDDAADASTRAGEPLHFIAMQLVEGRTLDDVIPRHGMPVEQFFEIGVALADALAAAHQHGVTHRDLKPANIMLGNDGRVRVLDFGLAKLVEPALADGSDTALATEADRGMITEDGKILGTAAYMSPEQAQGKPADPRSDVFALGIVLYQIATGDQPFAGDTKISILSSIIKDEPRPIVELNTNLPRHLGRIIGKCLEKDPSRRYQSALGVRNDLEALAEEVNSGEVLPVAAEAVRAKPLGAAGLLKYGLAGIALVAVVIIVAQQLMTSPPDVLRVGDTTQTTREPGLEIDPDISPDRQMVVYASGPQTQMRLYVRSLAGGRAVPLTEDFPGSHRSPRWSPDGSRIAFITYDTAWLVPQLGGVPLQLGGVPLQLAGAGNIVRGLAWSPDGAEVAIARDRGRTIEAFEVEGGESRTIVRSTRMHSPAWSPDGRWIAYVEGNQDYVYGRNSIGNIASSSIWLVSAQGGEPVQITDAQALNVSPVWMPDGRSLLFVSDRGGNRDVYRVHLTRSGTHLGEPERITTGLDPHSISVSADGSRLTYSEFRYSTNIWSVGIPVDEAVSVGQAIPVTSGNQIIEAMSVSPDGRWLAFDSNLSGNQDIFKMPIDGGEPQQLTTDPAPDFFSAWSPDGTEIAFFSLRAGPRRIFTVPATGGPVTQATHNEGQHRYPSYSPNGLRMVVSFTNERIGIVSRVDAGADWELESELIAEGGTRSRWSPDGRFIAYVARQGTAGTLMLVSPAGEQQRALVGPYDAASESPGPDFPAWSPDGSTVYYSAFDNVGVGSIWSVSVEGGTPRLLVRFDDPTRPLARRELAADADSLYFTIGNRESDIWVMELARQE